MNELLIALANMTTKEAKYSYEVSLQINTKYDADHLNGIHKYDSVKGTKAEAAKAIKKFTTEAKEFLFDERVTVIYLNLSHAYTTVRNIRIDLSKQNY